jgi:hypothetical protein
LKCEVRLISNSYNLNYMKSHRLIPILLIMMLVFGISLSVQTWNKPPPQVDTTKKDVDVAVKPYLTLRVRDQNGNVREEYAGPAHSGTVWLARILALHLGAQYLQGAVPYGVRAHATWAWPYTTTNTPTTYTHYGLDNGVSSGGSNAYQPFTLYVAAGKSSYASFDPAVSFLAPAATYRFEAAAAAMSQSSNATHAWVTLSATISVASALTVEDVALYLWPNPAGSLQHNQYCDSQRVSDGSCSKFSSGTAIATLIWWDKVPTITISAGGSLDVSYVFYTSFPDGGNLLSIIFGLLHTPRAAENLVIRDVAGASYNNYFPEFGVAYTTVGPATRYLWPALKLVWGTGTAATTGPWSPADLAARVGSADATLSVGVDPASGAITLTFAGIIYNTGTSPLTITEVAFQLGGPPAGGGVGELCLRQSGATALLCPDTGKAVLITYLPVNITIDPGKAVQVILKVRFSSV